MAFVRLPGTSSRYIDTTTGETISRRQYDKRFGTLAKTGFVSYEQRQSALKYRVQGPFPKQGSIHHTYDLALPNNVTLAIETVIQASPHFGTKMMIALEVEVYGDGKPYRRWIGSNVYRKSNGEITYMLEDLSESLLQYGLEFIKLQYQLTLIDRAT